ncbi:MAG: hypothetical protein ACREF4_09295 [Gammaproteobacteria bacterium]
MISGSPFRHLRWSRREFGTLGALAGLWRLLSSADGLVTLSVPGSSHRVHLRPGTPDEDVRSNFELLTRNTAPFENVVPSGPRSGTVRRR